MATPTPPVQYCLFCTERLPSPPSTILAFPCTHTNFHLMCLQRAAYALSPPAPQAALLCPRPGCGAPITNVAVMSLVDSKARTKIFTIDLPWKLGERKVRKALEALEVLNESEAGVGWVFQGLREQVTSGVWRAWRDWRWSKWRWMLVLLVIAVVAKHPPQLSVWQVLSWMVFAVGAVDVAARMMRGLRRMWRLWVEKMWYIVFAYLVG